ncbi:MAG: P-loop NTPase fold protein, partial [Gammaproteobacteria bacterium]
ECIKNIMTVSEITYIISADVQYLENAINHLYGLNQNPLDYLRKIFIGGYRLQSPTRDDYFNFLNNQFLKDLVYPITLAAQATECDLRTIVRLSSLFQVNFHLLEDLIFDTELWAEPYQYDSTLNTMQEERPRKWLGYLYIYIFLLKIKKPHLITLIKQLGNTAVCLDENNHTKSNVNMNYRQSKTLVEEELYKFRNIIYEDKSQYLDDVDKRFILALMQFDVNEPRHQQIKDFSYICCVTDIAPKLI